MTKYILLFEIPISIIQKKNTYEKPNSIIENRRIECEVELNFEYRNILTTAILE